MVDVQTILRRNGHLRAERRNWETLWEDITNYVVPLEAGFTTTLERGVDRSVHRFDDTASIAVEAYASAADSLLSPSSMQWHRFDIGFDLKRADPKIAEAREVKKWLDDWTDALFAWRYSSGSNYASQQHEAYLSSGSLGTGLMYIDDDPGGVIRYRTLHLQECALQANAFGQIDGLFREFELTTRQMEQEFGDDLPAVIAQTADKEKKWQLVHAIYPYKDDGEKPQNEAHRYRSVVVTKTPQLMLRDEGLFEFPVQVLRHAVGTREVYGRSPAILKLPTIRLINLVRRYGITHFHRRIAPVLLGAKNVKFRNVPDTLNRGTIDPASGRPLVQAFSDGTDPRFEVEFVKFLQDEINRAFGLHLFSVLAQDDPARTATDVMIRNREKGQLLGPVFARQQSEGFSTLIEREVGILSRQGRLPQPPERVLALVDRLERQRPRVQAYQPKFDAPINRARALADVETIVQGVSIVAPFAQLDPGARHVIRAPQSAKRALELTGYDMDLLADDEQIQAAIEADQQAAVAQTAAENAGGIAQAGRAMAEVANQR